MANNAELESVIRKVNASDDYFDILGVERSADAKEVTKAYRKLALKLHPDRCKHPAGEEAFKKVGNAFACLNNPDSRAHYERFGSEAGQVSGFPEGGIDPNDLFQQFFREMHEQGGGVGGGNSGFHFQSGNGQTFFMFNGGGNPFQQRGGFSFPPGAGQRRQQ